MTWKTKPLYGDGMKIIHGRKGYSQSFWGGCWHKEEVSFCGQKYDIGDWPTNTTEDYYKVTCKKCLKSIEKIRNEFLG